jgi:hypothetical protein
MRNLGQNEHTYENTVSKSKYFDSTIDNMRMILKELYQKYCQILTFANLII